MASKHWANKEYNKALAKQHIADMKERCAEDTEKSIDSTKHFRGMSEHSEDVKPKHEMRLFAKRDGIVEAIMGEESQGRLCVLDFASYKRPGGAFLDGAKEQEGSLCHASNLYNILSQFRGEFYNDNELNLNRGLYGNNLLYVPAVRFETDVVRHCDVIVCAAPNKKAAKKYNNVTDEEVYEALYERVDSILYSAYMMGVETLLLGAFGCGVFGNSIEDLAKIYNKLLVTEGAKYLGAFKKVVIVVPEEEELYKLLKALKD